MQEGMGTIEHLVSRGVISGLEVKIVSPDCTEILASSPLYLLKFTKQTE
jgi:hypothetical protein